MLFISYMTLDKDPKYFLKIMKNIESLRRIVFTLKIIVGVPQMETDMNQKNTK